MVHYENLRVKRSMVFKSMDSSIKMERRIKRTKQTILKGIYFRELSSLHFMHLVQYTRLYI